MRVSPEQVLIEDHSKEQSKAPKTDEKPKLQQQQNKLSEKSHQSDNQSSSQSFVNESEATLTELQKMQLNLNQNPAA